MKNFTIQQFPYRYKLLIRDSIPVSLFLAIMLAAIGGYAQAPKIGYAGPQVYTASVAISPLSPSNTGGAVATPSAVAIGTGFSDPYSFDIYNIAVDISGNVYVADPDRNTITKIPAGGGSQTTVGSGFSDPTGVAVDASGNIYVADYGNNAVKEIPAGGGAIVALGSGFNAPFCIALDAAGNIYVSENGSNGDVKKMPAGGGTPVVIGTGFNNPGGLSIAVDAKGNVFIEDTGNTKLKEIPAAGGGAVVIDQAFSSYAVAVDANDVLYLADNQPNNNSYQILRIPALNGNPGVFHSGVLGNAGIAVDANYNVYTIAGNDVYKINPGGYYINPALPQGLSFNNSTGVISGTAIYSSPATNYTITAYNSSGHNSATVNITVNAYPPPTVSYASPQSYPIGTAITPLSPGGSGVAAAGYSSTVYTIAQGFTSRQVAVDAAGNVYVAENTNGTVNKIPVSGAATVVGSGFNQPNGVAVDAAGNVYVADTGNGDLKKIPAGGGAVVTLLTGYGLTEIALDAAGNIYGVAEDKLQAIKVPANGGAKIILYNDTSGGGLTGVTVDGSGNVFLADAQHGAIVKIPATGGAPTTYASGFYSTLNQIAIDASGNIFYSYGSSSIGEIPAGGGSQVAIGSGFNNTRGVAVDGAGVVYVADNSNSAIKKVKPAGGYYLNKFLPQGLTLNNNTGAISGTPTVITPAANYTVTAYNVGNNAQATVNIQTTAGSDALANLQLSSGTLSPAFASATTSYTAYVDNAVTSITETPTAGPGGTITVNGTAVASGSASGAIALSVGANTITTVVTAPGGATTTYTVTVNRLDVYLTNFKVNNGAIAISPAFHFSTTSYTASVPNATTSVKILAGLAYSGSTFTINGMAGTSGTASAPIALAVGDNTIKTVVTGADGVTTLTYTLIVTRAPSNNASLSNLTVSGAALSPVFAGGTTSYTASVTGSSVTITPTTADAGATVTVNGTAVTSGSPSGAIALSLGANTITTVVTAQDGSTTSTYTVTVTRLSNNAYLSNLQINGGSIALTPAFHYTTTSYTASVPNTTASVKILLTLADATATVKVNGATEASGTASAPIALAVGSNTINAVVTAQNGTTTDTYTITVTRASPMANLNEVISVEQPVQSPGLENDGLVVHQGVSPNGDGINDFLVIDGILAYPDNKLVIMNRNGALVYEAKGYDNTTKAFDGHSNKTGAMQLPGTYFYQLEYAVNGITKHKTGFIVLKY